MWHKTMRILKNKVKNKKSLKTERAASIGLTSARHLNNNGKMNIYPMPSEFLQYEKLMPCTLSESFHQAIIPVLVIAQFFAIMPVINVKSKDPNKLYFKWTSARTIYAIIVILSLLGFSCITIYWSLLDKIEFQRIVPIIFYVSNTYIVMQFIVLAQKWPTLMRQWYEIEQNLPQKHNGRKKNYLTRQIRCISTSILLLSLTEHLLSILQQIQFPKHCPPKVNPTKDFFYVHLSQLFSITEYAPWKAFIGKIINILGTFAWSYMDLFVMLISVGLTSCFRQISDILRTVKGKCVSENFWAEHRINYRSLCNLCNTIDNEISQITMVSFSNNLYFICVQLLNSLNPMPTFVHGLYFWFSLIYLILRTLAVSLYSAEINSESKKPIEIFRSVPRESWCLEVKRFSEEVTNDTIALSGMKFFYLTRPLVLSVAGTIVTYELVLIQFHEDDKLSTNITSC